MTPLRWAAGLAIGLGIWVVSYCAGFTIYALTHTAETPQVLQEERPRLMQPDDPGFAEHLAQGCPGDVSWSPCALRLPDPIYTDGFTIEHDGITDVCRPAGETFICTTEEK